MSKEHVIAFLAVALAILVALIADSFIGIGNLGDSLASNTVAA